MNIIKIGQLIAESIDEGFDIAKLFADGKLSKDEIKKLCTALLEVVNTFLKLSDKKQLPTELADKFAEMLINGYDVYAILSVYFEGKK